MVPLSPLLTWSKGFIRIGEETGKAAPGHAPSTPFTPITPHVLPWALPSLPGSLGTPD